jgi:hypothetical protein
MLDDSRQKIKQVILDGIELKADYLCYHMQTTDYWDRIDKREDLIKESYDEAYHLMVFAGQKGFSGKFLIENLEYPKYPSTLGEMLAVREFLSIFPNSGILFDVAHQWHSCYLIREHQKDFVIQYPADIYLKSDGAYPAYLGATLKSLRPDAIHITGGSESGNKTHQMPEIEQVRENGSETVLDTGNAIRQIASAAASASKKMYMVNEAIGYPYEEMVKANVSLSELTRHL